MVPSSSHVARALRCPGSGPCAVAVYERSDESAINMAEAGNMVRLRRRGTGDLVAILVALDLPAVLVELAATIAVALLLANAVGKGHMVELHALASRYPFVANSRWFEDVFGRHIDAVAGTLRPKVADAARERGRARDPEATVQELLADC